MSLRERIRRWLGVADPHRGTLTIFEDGTMALGCPWGSSGEEIHRAQQRLVEWSQDKTYPLILAFPLDIVDQRYRDIPPGYWYSRT